MAVFVGLSLTLTACGSDKEPELVPTISVNGSASIEANGTVDGDITVTAENTDWSVDVTNGKEWLTAYKNGNKVTLSAKENQSLEDRTGVITVTASANPSLSQTVNVVQKGASATITVNGTEKTDLTFTGVFDNKTGVFDNKSGIDFKQTVKVVSNVTWSITGTPEWLSISPSNGNGNVDMVIYPTSENTTSSSRTATITVNGGVKSATINITQNAGKPVCYVDIANQVVLHDRMCWEYTATGNVNTFQWILLSEIDYERLTDKEIEELIIQTEKLKVYDDYLSFAAYDSNDYPMYPNTTYYMITLATDVSGKYGELRKKKVTTPEYKDANDDAYVSFDNVYADMAAGFSFDIKKEGYCNTYHLIYGNISSERIYNSAVYAFLINYYLKHKEMHRFAKYRNLEIVTDYPNNHTFVHYTTSLQEKPLCVAYAWGVFKDGTLSSDLIGFSWDTSKENAIKKVSPNTIRKNETQKVSPNTTHNENILISR